MMRLRFPYFLLLLLITGCGELKDLPTSPGDGDAPDPSATFSRVQNEIFTPSCALSTCHDAFSSQEGMTLSSGEGYSNTVGRKATQSSLNRIEPGFPERSYLYLKVTGSAGITGSQMPQNRTPLTDDKIRLLRDWIRRGAPND